MPIQKDTLRTKSVWVDIYILSGAVKCILAGIGQWKMFSFKRWTLLLTHCISLSLCWGSVCLGFGFVFSQSVPQVFISLFSDLMVR